MSEPLPVDDLERTETLKRSTFWPRLPGVASPTIAQDRRDVLGSVVEGTQDAIRARLCEPEYVQALLDGWLPMLRRGDRSARRDYLDVAKLTGSGEALAQALMAALGATLPVARQALEVQRDAGSLASDPEAMRARAEGYLLREYRANPALVERSPLGEVFGQRVTVEGDTATGQGPEGHGPEGGGGGPPGGV